MAKNNNYFKQMIDRYGENFISIITPDQIQSSAKRIIKELIKGDFDIEKCGQYFLDLKFLDNLIIAVTNELETTTLYYNAVCFYGSYYQDIPNITVHQTHLYTLCKIYTVMQGILQRVKYTGNIGCLTDASALLYNDRNHIS